MGLNRKEPWYEARTDANLSCAIYTPTGTSSNFARPILSSSLAIETAFSTEEGTECLRESSLKSPGLSSQVVQVNYRDVTGTSMLSKLLGPTPFRAHLVSPHSLPLHEVYYFDRVSSMKKVNHEYM